MNICIVCMYWCSSMHPQQEQDLQPQDVRTGINGSLTVGDSLLQELNVLCKAGVCHLGIPEAVSRAIQRLLEGSCSRL